MTPASVAVRIWLKTIVMGCILCSMMIFFKTDGFGALLYAILFFIIGGFVTLPLLMFISPLVKFSARLPYHKRARMGWLIFCLFILYFLVYMLVEYMYSGMFLDSTGTPVLMLVTFADLFIAVATTRTSLYKLYEPQ
jgi:hypothetical protein